MNALLVQAKNFRSILPREMAITGQNDEPWWNETAFYVKLMKQSQ